MKRVWDSDKKCLMAIDGEYEFEAVSVGNMIRQWKKSYFRKNSKKPCTIQLRCWYAPPSPDLWKYYIELVRDGEVSQTRICQEAYELIKGKIPSEERGGVAFVTLEQFKPYEK